MLVPEEVNSYEVRLNGWDETVTAKPATFDELTPLIEKGMREGLSFINKTRYYGISHKDDILGFCGLVLYGKRAIFKNDYVLEEWRGNRLWDILFTHRLNVCRALKTVQYIEADANAKSHPNYLRMGCHTVAPYKAGGKVRMYL